MKNKQMTEGNTISISLNEYENLRKENQQLSSENTDLKQRLSWLEECLTLKNKKLFGTSSEKTNEDLNQLSMFNEVEAQEDKSLSEPEIAEVKSYYRKKKVSTKDQLPEDIEVEIVEYRMTEEELACPCCNHQLHEMGSEILREDIKVIPAKVVLVRHIRYAYACRQCEKDQIEVPMVKAKVPNPPVKGGFASPEIVAYIMAQKYVLDIPLYRQEQDFKRRHIMLSRQTMCNWLMKCAESWLKPLYDQLQVHLRGLNAIHADETVLQVLKEPGKTAKSKSFMWLYRSGSYEKHQIALYQYAPSRSANHVLQFLDGFSGFCHVDGYQAYKKLPECITLVGCMAHARRKFKEAVDILTVEQRKGSKAAIGLAYCNQLFKLEDQIKDESPEIKYQKRQEEAKPLLDAFLAWLSSCNAMPKSHFGRAVQYTLNQWSYLVRYLEDGTLNISNNRAEHLAKSFAVCRKNFLFANTARGAEASGITYSLISTSMANNLDPYEYLSHIFRVAPNVDLSDVSNIEALLPWNVTLQGKES